MSGKSSLRAILTASVAMGAAVAMISPAFAQPASLGSDLQGQLATTDQRTEEGQFYDTYTVNLNAGQGIEVRVNSTDFDSYVYIGQGSGENWTELARDDDSGGELNSRLRFLAPEAGAYVVRASSFGAESVGAYSVSFSEARIVPPPTPIPLALGQTLSGSLTENSSTTDEANQPYDLYTYTGNTGDVVVFTMNAAEGSNLDSFVELGRMQEWGWEPWASDDDSGGSLNARLIYRLPEDGEYTLRAMGYSEGATGAYTVSATPYPIPDAPRPTAIRSGQTLTGLLEDGEIINDNLQIYDVYSLRVSRGREVSITLKAIDADGDGYADFDPYLELGVDSPAGWASVLADDDGAADDTGLHSRLTFTPTSSGTVHLRVMGLGTLSTGTYTISVE